MSDKYDTSNWREELPTLLKSHHQRLHEERLHMSQGTEPVFKAPIEDLINYVQVAQQTPEIWSLHQSFAERAQRDPDYVGDEEDATTKNEFKEWWQLKHATQNQYLSRLAYSGAGWVLGQIARGEIDGGNVEQIREALIQGPDIYARMIIK